MGLFEGGEMLMMPDSPSIMMDWASGRVRATRAIRCAWRVSTPYRSTGQALSADPLGAGASFAEAASGEYEPGVPVAFRWELGVAGVEGPSVSELGSFVFMFFEDLLVGTDNSHTLRVRKAAHLVGDLGYQVVSGESRHGLGGPSSEWDG